MDRELPFKTWDYEEQTKIKHLVFADYFDKWVKILGSHHNLNYFDCFGGKGAYKDKDGKIYFGSPMLAAEIIEKNKLNLNRKVFLTIIDKDKENIENIKAIFKYKNIDIQPRFVNADFDKTINEVIDQVPNLAPSFFFVDPFGFSINISTIKKMLKINKSEVLLNFMYNAINRFVDLPQNSNILDNLFGINKWRALKNISNREEELVKLYKLQLKSICKFVFPFRIEFPNMNRTYYYLFHLTNHIKGASIMKSCFAKYNFGRVEYLGNREKQLTFSDIKEIKINEIKRLLLEKYKNKINLLQILEDLIDTTPYLESSICNAIKELEEERKIEIKRDPPLTPIGKQRKSIINSDIIIFK